MFAVSHRLQFNVDGQLTHPTPLDPLNVCPDKQHPMAVIGINEYPDLHVVQMFATLHRSQFKSAWHNTHPVPTVALHVYPFKQHPGAELGNI